MKKHRLLLASLFFCPFASFANFMPQDSYVGILGGVANIHAAGLSAVQPDTISAISDLKNTVYPFIYGAVAGYDWCKCEVPISTEFMYLHFNRQKFKMSNLYPTLVVPSVPGLNYSEFDTLTVRSNIYLFNAIYHWPTHCSFRPFMGAGAGVAVSTVAGRFFSTVTTPKSTSLWEGYWRRNMNTRFAYNLLLGLSYTLCQTELSLTYQYLPLRKITTNGLVYSSKIAPEQQVLSAAQLNMSNVMLVLKYKF